MIRNKIEADAQTYGSGLAGYIASLPRALKRVNFAHTWAAGWNCIIIVANVLALSFSGRYRSLRKLRACREHLQDVVHAIDDRVRDRRR